MPESWIYSIIHGGLFNCGRVFHQKNLEKLYAKKLCLRYYTTGTLIDMKLFFLLLLLFIGIDGRSQEKTTKLFPYYENGKTGYINASGETVIKAIFLNGGEFSEGLAPVRIKGTYGYIGPDGNFVIEPLYDHAEAFHEGFAVVYQDGKPFYINKKGEKTPPAAFQMLGRFRNGIAPVKTGGGHMGCIDTTGKLLIDTVFSMIGDFTQGRALVEKASRNKKGDLIRDGVGVIDSLGRFVIPFGLYSNIEGPEDSYFRVEILQLPGHENEAAPTGFTDLHGNLLVSKTHENNSWIAGSPHDGLISMHLYKHWLPKTDGISYTTERSYKGFMNLAGQLVINDTNYRYAKDFSNNRAFVEDKDRTTYIIDRTGKKILNEGFRSVCGDGFRNGVAFVRKDKLYGMIDTNGVFLIPPKYQGIEESGLIGDYFFPTEGKENGDDYTLLYGIERKNGTTVLKPILQEFDRNGFQYGVLRCITDGKYALINEAGEIVWQEQQQQMQTLSPLNTDVMMRGYFYAYSKPDEKALGGHGSSDNTPIPIAQPEKFPERSLSVVVDPSQTDTMYTEYEGIIVYVTNTMRKAIQFSAQDSRLYMKVQAKDKNGEWRDIEYLPSSWCGNSYHILTLDPGRQWQFVTPRYEGDFKTRLRIQLKYIHPKDKKSTPWDRKEITVYSNEYEGSINPGQLWRKGKYRSGGLMDPYND